MLTIDDEAAVQSCIAAFVGGHTDLTGLELYYLLERATSLRELHLLLREGPRNRTAAGLQQSYGDHNRLLLLGLDRLLAGDVDWFRARVAADSPVAGDEVARCVERAADIVLSRPQLIALWLGAAVHDCGLLGGAAPSVDVEDATMIASQLLDRLCPPDQWSLTTFAIRNHDYVKDVFRGEVPASVLTASLDQLPAAERSVGLAALGLIQIAGAASLGEGRLTSFRLAIFDRCIDGSVLDGHTRSSRLARLLRSDIETVDVPAAPRSAARAAIDSEPVRQFLDAVPCHGWHRAWSPPADPVHQIEALHQLAALAHEHQVDHVVIERGTDLSAAGPGWRPDVEVVECTSGVRAALVQPA